MARPFSQENAEFGTQHKTPPWEPLSWLCLCWAVFGCQHVLVTSVLLGGDVMTARGWHGLTGRTSALKCQGVCAQWRLALNTFSSEQRWFPSCLCSVRCHFIEKLFNLLAKGMIPTESWGLMASRAPRYCALQKGKPLVPGVCSMEQPCPGSSAQSQSTPVCRFSISLPFVCSCEGALCESADSDAN